MLAALCKLAPVVEFLNLKEFILLSYGGCSGVGGEELFSQVKRLGGLAVWRLGSLAV